MNTESLLVELHEKGIKLHLDADKNIRVRGKKDNLTPELLSEIKNLKSELITLLDSGSKIDRTGIATVPRDQPIPASFSQQRLWFIDQMESGSTHYHIPGAMRIRGEFSVKTAEISLQRLVERHEPLRTVFSAGNPLPLQHVKTDYTFVLASHDLRASSESERQQQLLAIIEADLSTPFDLANDLMLRAVCIFLSDHESVLFFNMHHIAADGWSMGIIFNEFASIYKAVNSSSTIELEPLPFQYADYALWQQETLAKSAGYRTQIEYWQRQLHNLPQLHSLPTDFPRPPNQTFNGEIKGFEWNADKKKALEAFAGEREITPFVVLYGVFSWLLNIYSDESDIVIGTPVANRLSPELESLVGCFVNTLVLRLNAEFSGTFDEYLAMAKQVYVDAQANQDVPFEQLVERLNPVRSTSHSPLFQILFNMQYVSEGGDQAEALQFEPITLNQLSDKSMVAQYDLSLNVVDSQLALGFEIEYNRDLFSAERIERFLLHFEQLLDDVLLNSGSNIYDISVLSDEEQNACLQRFNHRSPVPPLASSLPDWFATNAAQTPNAVALRFNDDTLTYAELHYEVNQLAAYLIEQGVNKGDRVGVCLDPSFNLISSLLAVWKAGAAYVPIDPNYPANRIEHVLNDSGISVLISQSKICPQSSKNYHTINLDTFANGVPETSISSYPNVAAGDLAYVIYTSGSTGMPKGVMVEHGAVINFIDGLRSALPSVENSRWLLVTSFSFDIALFEWFGALTSGAECLIASAEEQKDPFLLKQLVEQSQPGLIQTTPSRWSQLIDAGWQPYDQLIALTGGEPLSDKVERALTGKVKSFWNCYGPTEATIWSLVNEIISGENRAKRFSLGQSLANYQHLALSPQLKLVPNGAIGELYIGGDSLARGYLNRAELTNERFIPNPYTLDSLNPRLYKTGDLVRIHDNGVIEYIGRTDDQVKVHGFRIELGEIEQQLNKIADIDAAVVTARAGADGDKQLIGYVVARESLEENNIRLALSKVLPDYMIPHRFVFLDAMPLTPNGKVDKKALPEPEAVPGNDRFVPPETDLQKQVASLWAELLQLPENQISLTQNFFSSGGHSLLSVRLVAALRDALKTNVTVKDVFQHPILENFVAYIEGMSTEYTANAILPLPESVTDYVASFAQQRLWIIDQMSANSAHYNMPGGLRVNGDFNVAAAEQALKMLVQRHEALRTSFIDRDSRVFQIIHNDIEFKLKCLDVSTFDEAEQESAIKSCAIEQVEKPFDLAAGLLIRVIYIRQESDKGVLIFNLHHIAADGWSMNILMDEFIRLYDAVISNRGLPLPPLAIQYKDFAAWQTDFLFGETESLKHARDKQLSYWQGQLDKLPLVHDLPTDFKRPQEQDFAGKHHNFTLDSEVVLRLKKIAHENGATLFMVLHAAFSMLLARYSNQTDIVVGTFVSNRTQKSLEDLVGFFVNTLVLRTKYDGELNFSDYLKHVSQVNVDAQSNQELPFDYLVEKINPQRNNAYSPLVQIVFNMNTQQMERKDIDGLSFSPLENYESTAQFDLALDVSETENGLWLDFEYATALFKTASIERMAQHFYTLLLEISEQANAPLKSLNILAPQEADQLVRVLGGTQQTYPQHTNVHTLFETHAVSAPDAVAIENDDETLTYDALNQRANRLAHYLVEMGITPGSLVGLSVSRSPHMVVGMLAVLKIGGAYVPLDPSYPPERLSFMAEDSGITCLLCEEGLANFGAIQSVALDDTTIQAKIEEYPSINLELDVSARDLAYVIYTSGSTGQPKGVMVEHRSIVRLVQQADFVQITPQDRVAQASNNSFDAATFEIWGALTNGARLVFVTKNELLHPPTLKRCLFEREISVLFVTTALLNQVAQAAPDTFSRLKHCLFGGEAVDKSSVDRILAVGKPERFLHVYGPTENTTFSTWYEITQAAGNYPIGKPVNQTQCFILDEFQSLLPKGAVGELCLAGDGLARGYLHRPDLTEQRFVPNPFDTLENTRLYRTGDLVRLNGSDQIEYVGRVDEQVKIRGFRIELGEIEQQLTKMSEIKDVFVTAREDVPGQKRLVAYIVIDYDLFDEEDEEDETFAADLIKDIRNRLSQAMPDYMVPSFYVPLERIPLTVNGKTDVAKLPVPDGITSMGEYVAPETDTERALVAIWSELLQFNAEDISVKGNFFELGGHSLLAIKQLVMIKKELGLDLDIKVLFESASIRDLSNYIDGLAAQRNLSASLAAMDEDSIEEMEF
ncbi:amino acid adenylation domain-containing protein [Teredinibacter turnerae]|uniref:amino acid adenylation domain-containing protein n=1 Tax=Teredinibacter turnerae TaxID=2426 RepID=UPI0030D4413E